MKQSVLGYNIYQLGLSLTQLQLIMVKEGGGKSGQTEHNWPVRTKKSIRKTILKKKIHPQLVVIFPTQAESFQSLPGE